MTHFSIPTSESPLFISGLTLQLTFMYGHPTVVTLDNLICILTVVAQTDTADENMLSAPGLGPVQKGILGSKESELSNVPSL